MGNKLKPCPFCGSKRINVWFDNQRRIAHCGCEDCGVFSFGGESKNNAIEAWNRRTEGDK